MTVIRLFARHPVAASQYSRLLMAQSECRILSNGGPFEIGLFDCDPAALEPMLILARRQSPSMRALLLSCDCDARQCLRLLFRGVWGLVPYDRYEEELPRAVRQIAEGRLWFPASIVVRWLQRDAASQASDFHLTLTQREREVFDFILEQLSNKEIATILRITESTVKFHVSNVFTKLQVSSRRDLSVKCALPIRHPTGD